MLLFVALSFARYIFGLIGQMHVAPPGLACPELSGEDGGSHPVMTLNVYTQLCVCRGQSATGPRSLGKKDALFL